MKYYYYWLLVVIGLVSFVPAKNKSLGVGLIISEPTGLSIKALKTGRLALDGAAAWSLGSGGRLHLHADLLYHNCNIFTFYDVNTCLYYGAGLRVTAGNGTGLGVRIPVGLSYLIDDPCVEIFAELVPGVEALPATRGTVDAGIGFRYYFL